MPTKRAPSDRSNKRLKRNDDAAPAPTSMDLNDNCLVNILSYLHFEDLNSFAICSRRSRDIRAHESLNQTRTGTIICPQETVTMDWFHDAINNNGWNAVFTGNRTHLKIKGLDRVINVAESGSPEAYNYLSYGLIGRPKLPEVTSLDLSIDDGGVENGVIDIFAAMILAPRLLNLRCVNVSNVKAPLSYDLLGQLTRFSPIERVIANKTNHMFVVNGAHVAKVSEITANDSLFIGVASLAENDPMHEMFPGMLSHCSQLEHLSITNASWTYEYSLYDDVRPVTQEMLVKMARSLPKLVWLKSDLSKENVAMLQLERPEIMFADSD